MIYRLGICSDTHAQIAPTFDPASVSALLHAGDFYDAAGDPEALDDDPLQKWLGGCVVPCFAVRGNHDYVDLRGNFRRWEDITGSVRQLCPGLFVAGVGFAPRQYLDLPGETDLQPVCQQVLRHARRVVGSSDRIVLLTHYPTKFVGVADEWQHFECARELVEELLPVAVVQGHVHELFGQRHRIQVLGRSVLLVYPGPVGGVLEIDISSGDVSLVEGGG